MSEVRWAAGPFEALHRELEAVAVDVDALDVPEAAPELLERARRVWQSRVHAEFRAIQVMIRFTGEVVAARDPIDVYAGAWRCIGEEIRQTALAARVCAALGGDPTLPRPLAAADSDEARGPVVERALGTALSALAVSESISLGFLDDLASRCDTPVLREVLAAMRDGAATASAFGWSYVEASVRRFPPESLPTWRRIALAAAASHVELAGPVLEAIAPERRDPAAWPDDAEVALGVLSPQRQALVFHATWEGGIAPRLAGLGLL